MLELQDFRDVSDTSIATDVCIIGTGPAALAIAQELGNTPHRVLLLESGAREPSPVASALCGLDEVENVGAPRQADQTRVRTRALGGASCVWNGRCAPVDPSDMQSRTWLPLSGWPITHAQLEPYFTRAAARLGLSAVAYDARLDRQLGFQLPYSALWSDALRSFCWQFSLDDDDASVAMRCARTLLRNAPANVRVLLHATATELVPDSSGSRIESVEIRSLTGKLASVRAHVYVVCAGGIETPRLLLASRRTVPCGLGNQHDQVGRHLMDHVRCSLGQFALPQGERLRPALSLQRLEIAGRSRYFLRGLALSQACQQQEQLLNCAAWLHETEAPDDPWSALKRLGRLARAARLRNQRQDQATDDTDRARLARDVAAILRQPRLTSRQVYRKWIERQPVQRKLSALELMCDVEQAPDPLSRITLAERTDVLGVPLARIDWRISELQVRTLQRFGQHAVRAFEDMRWPALQLHERVRAGAFEPGDLLDAAHPSGTTRMASDPRHGVVDAHCQVHGIARLYVAGTAVFPTQGHANPTLTLVAMAIRLADRLKAYDLARPASERQPRQPREQPTPAPPPTQSA